MGNYSFNYESSKKTFAERSGLIDKNRQFGNQELADIYRSVSFAKDMVCRRGTQYRRTINELGYEYGVVPTQRLS